MKLHHLVMSPIGCPCCCVPLQPWCLPLTTESGNFRMFCCPHETTNCHKTAAAADGSLHHKLPIYTVHVPKLHSPTTHGLMKTPNWRDPTVRVWKHQGDLFVFSNQNIFRIKNKKKAPSTCIKSTVLPTCTSTHIRNRNITTVGKNINNIVSCRYRR